MQNDNLKLKITLISIAVLGAGFLFVLPTNATENPLIVEYSTDGGVIWLPLSGPIFQETNFVPGDGVSRLIRATNNSGQAQRIATEAINENDPNDFAFQLNLTIKEGETLIFNKTLKDFFDQGETYLSGLADGGQNTYEFAITFYPSAGDEYQEKALGFDILVGFEGTEGGLPLPEPGGGTGGGGGLPEGLTILNETEMQVGTTSVTIYWTTNYFSSSQVIYGIASEKHTLDLTDNTGTPPKYGYEQTTPEYDVSPKVTDHAVTITDLIPGTTYYYRAVSHASFAVSTEHSFTTSEYASGQSNGRTDDKAYQEETIKETAFFNEEGGFVAGTSTGAEQIASVNGSYKVCIGAACKESGKSAEEANGMNFLAAVGGFSNKTNYLWLLILLIVIIVFIFCIIVFRMKKKRSAGDVL